MIEAHYQISKEQYANAVHSISKKISRRPAFLFFRLMLMSTGLMAMVAVLAGAFVLALFYGEKISYLYLGFCLVWAMACLLSSSLYKQSIREIPLTDSPGVGQMHVSLSNNTLCIEKPGVIKTELPLSSILRIEELEDSVLIYIDNYQAFCLDRHTLEEVGLKAHLLEAIPR